MRGERSSNVAGREKEVIFSCSVVSDTAATGVHNEHTYRSCTCFSSVTPRPLPYCSAGVNGLNWEPQILYSVYTVSCICLKNTDEKHWKRPVPSPHCIFG